MANGTQSVDFRERFKRAVLKIKKLNAELDVHKKAQSEPIAIVGMSCRFPGGSHDPDSYWAMLKSGRDGVVEVPPERWGPDEAPWAFDDAETVRGTRWGGFLTAPLDTFDPAFFGISPREAKSLDPQQRLLLEVAWEALEHANIPPERLFGSRTGVFVGMSSQDYQHHSTSRDRAELDVYDTTGNMLSIAGGRLSYVLGLQGPNVTLDTACSSSLVSVHLAVQSLRRGESDLALAGGVNLILSPMTMFMLARTGALSPDGRCKAFDASANGFVRGEGCGLVALKRLSDAQADGDDIWAVIRGSAVNQDGRSTGLTAPNVLSQKALLKQALENAQVSPEDVTYIEAHGTGTSLGDPIEVDALKSVIGAPREGGSRCLLSSVKSNIGHLEAASGIAGLIKMALSMRHEEIPGQLHYRRLNPRISFDGTPFFVSGEHTPWRHGEGPRIAGVSGFGLSGTNAHIIIDEPPQIEGDEDEAASPLPEPSRQLALLSARTEASLAGQAARLSQSPALEQPLADVCHTLATARTHFDQRLGVIAADAQALKAELTKAAEGKRSPNLVRGSVARGATRPRVAFLFTGQGSQYVGMGAGLYASQATFRQALDEADAALAPHLGSSIKDVIFPPEGGDAKAVNNTAFTQPALFAIEYALASLWRSLGITPDVVMGHSVGEFAAAVVAGVMSLADGAKLIVERGRRMQALPQDGTMAALKASPVQAEAALAPHVDGVSIAAYNGPRSVVISGRNDGVQAICEALAADGVKAKELVVSHAFHSPLMEPMLDGFEAVAASLKLSKPNIPLLSNLTGALAGDEITRPRYWRDHVRSPVRFAQGMAALEEMGVTLFIEIGPSPTLLGMGAGCVSIEHPHWLPSLRKGKDDWQILLKSVATLHTLGQSVDLEALHPGRKPAKVKLPTYAFDRKRYWIDRARGQQGGAAQHPLLGAREEGAEFPTFSRAVSADQPSYLADHVVMGQAVFPAAAYWEMARAAAVALFGPGAHQVSDVVLQEALVLPAGESRTLRLSATGPVSEATPIEISSVDDLGGAPVVHATATLLQKDKAPGPIVDVDALRARCDSPRDADEIYASFDGVGLSYGPSFQGLKAVGTGQAEAFAEVSLPEGTATAAYGIHPGLLDACLQTLATLVEDEGDAYLPFALGAFTSYAAAGSAAFAHARIAPAGPGTDILSGDIFVIDAEGQVLAEVKGLRVKRIDREALKRGENKRAERWVHTLAWRPLPNEGDGPTGGRYLLLSDQQGVGASVAQHLRQRGAEVLTARQGDAFRIIEPGLVTASALSATDMAQVVAKATEGGALTGVIHLWALDTPDAEGDDAIAPQEALCSGAVHLVEAIARGGGSPPPRSWWVTRGAQRLKDEAPAVGQATLWGLGRVAALEHPESRAVLVDLDPQSIDAAALVSELGADGQESQVAFRGGQRFGARLSPSRPGSVKGRLAIPDDEAYRLIIPQRGSLSNLVISPVERPALEAGQVEIEVYASGLNFRDVLNVLGMYPGDPGPLGAEAAGVVSAIGPGVENVAVGDAVMAMGPASHGRYLITDHRYLAKKPEGLSFEDAATMPVVFLTAWYALHHLGGLKKGEKILIHAAAGGVGMAAVQLAQWVGAEVFGTASTPKWETLRQMGVPHIMNSRTLDFFDQINEATDGTGVDVVLNALTGEFITKSMRLLAEGGRFLEMGKAEIWTDEQVASFRAGVSYQAFDLSVVDGDIIGDMFSVLMDAYEAGHIRPLPKRVFPLTEAVSAFRFMAQAKHIGKVILANDVTLPSAAATRPKVRADGTYLITGGMGALGLAVAQWLVDQGARHLALMGRSAPKGEALAVISALEARGATVQISRCDVADLHSLTAALEAMSGPALAGVIHAAGVLDDGPILRQRWERFAKVMGPKVQGAYNLHTLTQSLDLDLFVLFSSAASLLGSPGQSNYASANAYLDALAQLRQSQGLPAVSIGWGGWAQGGMAETVDERTRKQWAEQGLTQIQVSQGLHLLGKIIEGDEPHVGVLPIQWKKMAATLPMVPSILSEVAPADEGESADGDTAGSDAHDALMARLREAPADARPDIVRNVLRGHVAGVLGLGDPEEVEPEQPLAEMGLDSLMAVELRNVMSETVGQTLPATLVFDYPTLDQISAHLLEEYLKVDDSPAASASSAPASVMTPLNAAEPIAVVGVGCRFAGGVDSVATFWDMLMEGRNGISEVPASRWDIDALYDEDIWAPGKMYTRYGGFLDNVDQFEPQFFGVIQREAVSMDPQQRLLLEVSWEALENAAIPPASLMGSETGVFVGICSNDYGNEALEKIDNFNAYSGTGNFNSVASGRISYLLGLRGPSIALDTACSSSLVSIHLAVQSLRSGESNLALAGGVNLILSPTGTLYFSKIQALAADGRTKAFDASADGYVRAEGCGMIVLKRLSDAQRDGDRILALIRGSAVNQDGRSNGLTAPNGPAQQQVIRKALASAGVAPHEVSYVEAHGTGTPLGDPIELQALGAVLKEGRAKGDRVTVGTVKTNFGHSEGASGVAGVIKTILALQGETIPQNLHFEKPNPHIPWDQLPLKVAAKASPWPRGQKRRVAGVSSFGLSGTNAHVVLEEAPADAHNPVDDRDTHLVLLSARKAAVVPAVAKRLLQHLKSYPDLAVGEVCNTLAVGRVHHRARLLVPVKGRDALMSALERIAEGGEPVGAVSGTASAATARGKLAFLMGHERPLTAEEAHRLYGQAPAFTAAMDQCAAAAGVHGVGGLLAKGGAAVTCALQWSLAQMHRSWGLSADGALTTGVGLWAGACLAGVMVIEDAISLLVGREEGVALTEASIARALHVRADTGSSFRLFHGDGAAGDLVTASGALPALLANAAEDKADGASLVVGLEAGKSAGLALGLAIGRSPVWASAIGRGSALNAVAPFEGEAALWGGLYRGLAHLHLVGKVIDWQALEAPFGHRRIGLPTYPFQRKRYWIEAP